MKMRCARLAACCGPAHVHVFSRGAFEQPFWSSTMGVVHKQVGGTLVPADQDPFKYSQPDSLSAALRRAGFERVEEETRTIPWTWPGTAEKFGSKRAPWPHRSSPCSSAFRQKN